MVCASRANVTRFETYCRRKENVALATPLSGFRTIEDVPAGVDIVDAGDPVSLSAAMRYLRNRGLRVISAIGGRTAMALLREGLVSDVYLTTSAIEAGAEYPVLRGSPAVAVTRG